MLKLFFWIFSALPSIAIAHGGGLNAEGCHNNRRTGDYHCHRSGYSPPRHVAPAPAVQPLYAPVHREPSERRSYRSNAGNGAQLLGEGGPICAKDIAAERSSCQGRRRADLEQVTVLEQQVHDLNSEVRNLRAEVRRLQAARAGYFP